MQHSGEEIALASGILAGQMTLAGLILVFHGLVLSRYLELKDSAHLPLKALSAHRKLLYVTAFGAAVVLIAAVVPAVWFTRNVELWALYAVFVLSILLLLSILWQAIQVFR